MQIMDLWTGDTDPPEEPEDRAAAAKAETEAALDLASLMQTG